MAKKNAAQNSRRAVIDDIRKKQARADRRQGLSIILPLALVAVLLVGAAAFRPVKDWWDERRFNDVDLASIGPKLADVCTPISTQPADGNMNHVPTGTKVEYTTAPPAFGAHWNEAGVAPVSMSKKFYAWDERPELESLVHNLEHGYSIVWYDETVNEDPAQLTELRAIANKFPGDTNFRYKFKVVPWKSKGADKDGDAFPDGKHIAITHWSAGGAGVTDAAQQVGAFQYCSEISGEALKEFMLAYPYFDSPEPDAM